MMNLRSAVLGCVAAIAMAVPAFAGPIHGQMQYGTSGTPTYSPTTNGTSLAVYAGTVTFSTNVTSTGPFPTIDDFAGKTLNSGVAASTITWNGSTVTINYGTLGSFTGNIDAVNSVEAPTARTISTSVLSLPGPRWLATTPPPPRCRSRSTARARV